MRKIVYVAGPLFSQGERQFLEQIVLSLSSSSGLDLTSDVNNGHETSHAATRPA